MENVEAEVYLVSRSHCRVGKVTPKTIEEDQTTKKVDS